MNFEQLYGYLINVTWFFLGTWVLLLVAAGAATFGNEESTSTDSPQPSKP